MKHKTYVCYKKKGIYKVDTFSPVVHTENTNTVCLQPRRTEICCYSVAWLCLTLCDPVDCNTPGFPVLHHLWEFAQTHVHWIGDSIQPSHPLLPLLFLPSIFPASESFPMSLWIRWPKYWNLSFSISPANEYQGWFPLGLTGLISCGRDTKSEYDHWIWLLLVMRCHE